MSKSNRDNSGLLRPSCSVIMSNTANSVRIIMGQTNDLIYCAPKSYWALNFHKGVISIYIYYASFLFGGQCPCSKTILNDWSRKIASVFKLIVLGSVINRLCRWILSSQILGFSDMKSKSVDRFFDLQSNTRENL